MWLGLGDSSTSYRYVEAPGVRVRVGVGVRVGFRQAGRLRALLQPLRALASHAALLEEAEHLLHDLLRSRVRVRVRVRGRGRVGARVEHLLHDLLRSRVRVRGRRRVRVRGRGGARLEVVDDRVVQVGLRRAPG